MATSSSSRAARLAGLPRLDLDVVKSSPSASVVTDGGTGGDEESPVNPGAPPKKKSQVKINPHPRVSPCPQLQGVDNYEVEQPTVTPCAMKNIFEVHSPLPLNISPTRRYSRSMSGETWAAKSTGGTSSRGMLMFAGSRQRDPTPERDSTAENGNGQEPGCSSHSQEHSFARSKSSASGDTPGFGESWQNQLSTNSLVTPNMRQEALLCDAHAYWESQGTYKSQGAYKSQKSQGAYRSQNAYRSMGDYSTNDDFYAFRDTKFAIETDGISNWCGRLLGVVMLSAVCAVSAKFHHIIAELEEWHPHVASRAPFVLLIVAMVSVASAFVLILRLGTPETICISYVNNDWAVTLNRRGLGPKSRSIKDLEAFIETFAYCSQMQMCLWKKRIGHTTSRFGTLHLFFSESSAGPAISMSASLQDPLAFFTKLRDVMSVTGHTLARVTAGYVADWELDHATADDASPARNESDFMGA